MVITDVDILTKNCYEAIAVELFFYAFADVEFRYTSSPPV